MPKIQDLHGQPLRGRRSFATPILLDRATKRNTAERPRIRATRPNHGLGGYFLRSKTTSFISPATLEVSVVFYVVLWRNGFFDDGSAGAVFLATILGAADFDLVGADAFDLEGSIDNGRRGSGEAIGLFGDEGNRTFLEGSRR
ncbi:MAG: hypothetical protein U0744_16975 [Gemmataceae bacterium]